VHDHLLSLYIYTVSLGTKLWCTLQLRGKIHSISTLPVYSVFLPAYQNESLRQRKERYIAVGAVGGAKSREDIKCGLDTKLCFIMAYNSGNLMNPNAEKSHSIFSNSCFLAATL
jgi:hypothetical protein